MSANFSCFSTGSGLMPDDDGLQLLQLRERVLQVARLLRAAGRVGLRVEVHDDALALEARQAHELAVLVLQRERRRLVADCELRHRDSSFVSAVRCARSMPRVRRPSPVRLAAPADAVRAAAIAAPRRVTALDADTVRRPGRRPRAQRRRRRPHVLAPTAASGDRRHDRAARPASTSRSSAGRSGPSSRSRSGGPARTRSRGCGPSSTDGPARRAAEAGGRAPDRAVHRRAGDPSRDGGGRGRGRRRSRAALVGQLGGPISHSFHASDSHLQRRPRDHPARAR